MTQPWTPEPLQIEPDPEGGFQLRNIGTEQIAWCPTLEWAEFFALEAARAAARTARDRELNAQGSDWVHHEAVWDKANNECREYADGKLVRRFPVAFTYGGVPWLVDRDLPPNGLYAIHL